VVRALNNSLSNKAYFVTELAEAKSLASKVSNGIFVANDHSVGNQSVKASLLGKISLAVEAVLLRQDIFQALQGQRNILIPNASIFQNAVQALTLFRLAAERLLAAA